MTRGLELPLGFDQHILVVFGIETQGVKILIIRFCQGLEFFGVFFFRWWFQISIGFICYLYLGK